MTSGTRIARREGDERHPSKSMDNVVRELERHGYVADPYSMDPGAGALFRHAAAPNLVVHEDGRIELPSGQLATQSLLPPPARIRWRRTLLVVTLLCAAIFMGLIVTALIVG